MDLLIKGIVEWLNKLKNLTVGDETCFFGYTYIVMFLTDSRKSGIRL